jgi:hypothetical protein
MPTIRREDVRLPELHLPEMSKDDIVKAISDAGRDVDLSRLDPRRIDLSKLEVDLSKLDLPRAVADAAESTGFVKVRRASRMPMILGAAVVIGLAGFALLTRDGVRSRLDALMARGRERLDEWRGAEAMHGDDPVAFDAAETARVQASPYAGVVGLETTPFDGPSELPENLGANGQVDKVDAPAV